MPVSFFFVFMLAPIPRCLRKKKESIASSLEPEPYFCEINKRGHTVKASKLYRQTPQNIFQDN